MSRLRLMKMGFGDQCLAEWSLDAPETVCRAREQFREHRVGRLAFRLDGPGRSSPIGPDEDLPEDALDVLIVPAIAGGAPEVAAEPRTFRFRTIQRGVEEYFALVTSGGYGNRSHPDAEAYSILESMGFPPDTDGWFEPTPCGGYYDPQTLSEVIRSLTKAGHLVTFSCPPELREVKL